MPASEAQIRANQANALKSTGPKTSEGKEQSRRNGLKHGLTGEGVVVDGDEAAEVERRVEGLRAELGAKSQSGKILVRQMALNSVRMERAARQEMAAVAHRVRYAARAFDEERLQDAEELYRAIDGDPRSVVRMLRKRPEGVDLMLKVWREIRDDLTLEPKPHWAPSHLVKAAQLSGIREREACGSSLGMVAQLIWDNDPTGFPRMIERVDLAIQELEEHRATLDLDLIEQDRAEAGDRALFDPSKEAALARRYEAEATRGFYRALNEFRKVEAEAQEQAAIQESAPPAPRRLGSSWAGERRGAGVGNRPRDSAGIGLEGLVATAEVNGPIRV